MSGEQGKMSAIADLSMYGMNCSVRHCIFVNKILTSCAKSCFCRLAFPVGCPSLDIFLFNKINYFILFGNTETMFNLKNIIDGRMEHT